MTAAGTGSDSRARSWLQRQSAATWVVNVALLLAAVGGPVSYMFGQPAYSTGDEPPHVDYAYEIWHGHFPSFYRGLELANPVGGHPSVQWTSQHPPLFYVLLAPVIGPLADGGHFIAAVMWARAVMVILGVLTVFAARWMVRGMFPGTRWLPSLAALLFALASWYPRQGGSVYNDMLAALVLMLATGFAVRSMREPGRRDWLAGLFASSAACGLTRFSLLPQLVVMLVFLFAHRWLVERQPLRRASIDPAATAMIVIATSGWWYWRNYRLTGNFQGEHFRWFRQVAHTHAVPVGDVISSGRTWRTMLDQYFSIRFLRDGPRWDPWQWRAELWLLLVPLALGVVLLALHLARARRAGRSVGTTAVFFAMITAMIADTVGMQISHIALGNHNLARYFLPIMPFAATLIAFGLCRVAFGRLLLLAWLVARLAAFSVEVRSTIDRPLTPPQAPIWPGWSWTGYWLAVAGATALTAVLAIKLPEDRRLLIRRETAGSAAPRSGPGSSMSGALVSKVAK